MYHLKLLNYIKYCIVVKIIRTLNCGSGIVAEKHLVSRDQFLCCIYLDVLSGPVIIPCGHNFCKLCIIQHWETQDKCKCPVCQKNFDTKPELNVNTPVSEFKKKVRDDAQREFLGNNRENQECHLGDVPCDACTRKKQKAVKSCMVCLVSYCSAHLEPHQTLAVLKKHQLIDPMENLEARMCVKHKKAPTKCLSVHSVRFWTTKVICLLFYVKSLRAKRVVGEKERSNSADYPEKDRKN